MNLVNTTEQIIGAVVVAIVSAVGWLIRTVLTNNKAIALLQSEIKDRDKRRDEDRQILIQFRDDFKSEMKETREDIEDIRHELLEVWKTK